MPRPGSFTGILSSSLSASKAQEEARQLMFGKTEKQIPI